MNGCWGYLATGNSLLREIHQEICTVQQDLKGWITQQPKNGSRPAAENIGKDDENDASKLLCGCNYQGGRRDRPASLRLMHQRQPIIIDFFLFFT